MSTVTTLPSANSHYISLTDAATMTAAYRSGRETMLDEAFRNAEVLPLSETFNRLAIDALLAQPGCEGLRVYYGTDEESKVHAILVAVTEDNEDILPSVLGVENSEEDIIVEMSQRCPDMCPPTSPLNS